MADTGTPIREIDALVFDAYGTLFDVHSVTDAADRLLPGHGAGVSHLWRVKQLEYTWLSSLMRSGVQPRENFESLTARALAYTVDALGLHLDDAGRKALLDAYLTLLPFPDVVAALTALAPRPRLILSNGTLAMLEPVVMNAGLRAHIAATLSVDAADVYKPDPRVYQLAADHLRLPPRRIGFVSSNCWDAIGARAFGFTAFWINRAGAPVDRHGPAPDRILTTLADLPPLLGQGR